MTGKAASITNLNLTLRFLRNLSKFVDSVPRSATAFRSTRASLLCALALVLFSPVLASATTPSPRPHQCSEVFSRNASPFQGVYFYGRFIAPNETFPQDARPIFAAAQPGVLLAVGTERVLLDYLMTDPNKDIEVVAIDGDPNVHIFHRLNQILIKGTRTGDLADYRELRFNLDWDIWQFHARSARQGKRITSDEFKTLMNPVAYRWWKEYVTDNGRWQYFYAEPKNERDHFYAINYLFDASLFTRLQKLFRARKFHVHPMDLRNPEHNFDLVEKLLREGKTLSAIDISNAWEQTPPLRIYLGPEKTGELMHSLNPLASNDSLFIYTFGTSSADHWFYRGHTFRYMRSVISGFEQGLAASQPEAPWINFAAKFAADYIQSTKNEEIQRADPHHRQQKLDPSRYLWLNL